MTLSKSELRLWVGSKSQHITRKSFLKGVFFRKSAYEEKKKTACLQVGQGLVSRSSEFLDKCFSTIIWRHLSIFFFSILNEFFKKHTQDFERILVFQTPCWKLKLKGLISLSAEISQAPAVSSCRKTEKLEVK